MTLKTISFVATENIVDALTDLLDEIKEMLSGENIITVIVDPSNPQGKFIPNAEIIIYNNSAISDIKIDNAPLDYEEEEEVETESSPCDPMECNGEKESEMMVEEGYDNQKSKKLGSLKLKLRKQSK
jgi:hypothetical protein